ncbi:BTAD domain-containing putative transcriptional regulator [Streptomyces argenteolus]|uniref:BTAD domain-containing putative transcriptional regulator n=1 Tax=Streptomyces argenteolus TaxID=67274 RepID=A0ABW6X735_9ACTN
MSTERRAGPEGPRARIGVLGGFGLWVGGDPVTVPVGSEKVLAFLALRCRAAVPRPLVAGTLWPEASERCAHADLRAALARLNHRGRQALDVTAAEVRLAPGTSVDLHHVRRTAQLLVDPTAEPAGAAGVPGAPLEIVRVLSAELLPGWYEDWALSEAEEWRQLRLHALETLAGRLRTAGRYAEAIAAAQAAVHAEPLRESGQTCLVMAHLSDGNLSEALNAFTRYARRLRDELGLDPPEHLYRLVSGCARASGTATPGESAAREPPGAGSRGRHATVTPAGEEWQGQRPAPYPGRAR